MFLGIVSLILAVHKMATHSPNQHGILHARVGLQGVSLQDACQYSHVAAPSHCVRFSGDDGNGSDGDESHGNGDGDTVLHHHYHPTVLVLVVMVWS